MTLWRCEIWNSYTDKGSWTKVEIAGADFCTAFWKRFGRLKFRNVERMNERGEWEKEDVECDWK